MMEAYPPSPTEDIPGRAAKTGYAGDVARVLPHSVLTAAAHGGTTGSSHVPQQDLNVSVSSNQLHDGHHREDHHREGHHREDHHREGHNHEGNDNSLTRDDGSRQSTASFTSHSEFRNLPGRQRGAYSSSYPKHNGINTSFMDLGDLEELAHTTSQLTDDWNQDLFSYGNNRSHSTDVGHTGTSLVDKHSARDNSSHSTDVRHVGTTARYTTIFTKNIHSRNWVNFEDDDGSVESTSDDIFTPFNHHPASEVVKKHVAISDDHSTNSSRDRHLPDQARGSANRRRARLDYDSSTDAPSHFTTGLHLVINAGSLKEAAKRVSSPIFSHGHPATGGQWRHNQAHPASPRDTQHSNMSVNNGVTEKDTSLLQHRKLLRPHSVDTSLQATNSAHHVTDDLLSNSASAGHRQKQFTVNYRSSKYSSLPENSNLSPSVKVSVQSERSNVKPSIFRTSSSASLHSDSSINTTPVAVPSPDAWKKALHWVSAFMSTKGTSAPVPIDDSMEFGQQPSLFPKDKVPNAESKRLQKIDTIVEQRDLDADTKLETTKTAVYKKRWYLLFVFSLSAMLWNAVWSTWGPIAQSAKDVYDWTDGDIAMFIWLGNIPFLLTMFPCSYLMDVKGMRIAMIVACGFMFLGTGFRCIPSDVATATWLIRIGQFLNGMAGTIPNSAPALLSGLWFPPNQRASATAISTVAGYMGASVSFVIGPLLVPQNDELLPINITDDVFSVGDFFYTDNVTNVTSYDVQKNGIMTILYGEFAVAGLLLLLVLIYFPSKPPLPPSVSASMPREKYLPGLKMLVRNKQFWVCAIAFSVPAGVYEAWQVILDVILDDKGVSQQTAGWLDFYATVGGCVSGLLVSRFADFFTRQMKLFLLVFYFFAAVSILWFTLVVFDILPFDRVSMYAAIIIAGVFLDGGGPLFFELTIEVSYPVGEGVTSGFTQMLCAGAGICFLSVVQVESLGKEWINWYFLGCVAMAIPLLFFITTTYGRADLDDGEEEGNLSPDTDEKTYLISSSHV